MMSYFPKVILVALSSVGSKCLCTILSEASQTHTVAVKPPEGFNQRRMSDGEYFNQRYGNAFYKDALRDKKIFGLDVIENRDMSVNSKFKKSVLHSSTYLGGNFFIRLNCLRRI